MSEPEGRLYPGRGPGAARFSAALTWLWRLGPLLEAPRSEAIGIGGAEDAEEFAAMVKRGDLAGACVFVPTPGPAIGPVPGRASRAGPTRFPGAGAVADGYPVFAAGRPTVSSKAGPHAVVCEGILALAADPEAEWGRLGVFWVIEALASYLLERIDRPLILLPEIGMLRLDDLPGTAQHQLEGRAKGDRRQGRRLRRYVDAFRGSGAVLNAAVPAEAFAGEDRVPLDRVWPESIAAMREGVRAGAVEAVCHGLLHLDTDRLAEGEIEFREFARLDEQEAGRRLDLARDWQERAIGPSKTFVAAAWAYSEGSLNAAAARDIPCFRKCEAGRIFEPGQAFETLQSGHGIHRLDYRPLARLAELGLPPTLVMHGTLIDARPATFRFPRDAVAAARLLLRRDLLRLPAVGGLRWVGAAEYVDCLRRHGQIEVRDGEPQAPPGTRLRIRHRDATRSLTA